jgi:hypothetical protein
MGQTTERCKDTKAKIDSTRPFHSEGGSSCVATALAMVQTKKNSTQTVDS